MKKLILPLVASIGMMACDKDDSNRKSTSDLVGNWELVSYSRNGFSKTLHYNENDVVWKISDNNTIEVNVASNLDLPNEFPIIESGVFGYQVNENNEIHFVDTNKTYSISIKDNTLYLNNHRYADGEKIIFKK